MPGETERSELRLRASATSLEGKVEVAFLHHMIELEPAQARMFARALMTAITQAESVDDRWALAGGAARQQPVA